MKFLLTLQDTAEQLDVSVRTVRRMIDGGRLSVVRVLGAVRVPAAELAQWVENNSTLAERDQSSAKHLYPLFTGILLNDITGPVVSDYISQRRNVAAAGTFNKEVGLLSSAITWATR